MDRGKIESIIRENGYDDFKWIAGKDVVVPNGRDSSVCMALFQLREERLLPTVSSLSCRMPGIFQRV
jgi:hypothetical protein